MTRETKIGLLVGLAFIIIVGILLSEPLNHAGDSQPAPLPGAGNNVRMAVNSPGTASAPPPISMQNNPAAAPPQQVMTQQEVTHQRSGIQVVVGGVEPAGGGNVTPPSEPHTTQLSNAGQVQLQQPTPQHARNEPPQVVTPHTPNSDPIFQAAGEHGQELVPLGNGGTAPGHGGVKPTAKAGKQYQAAAGDSISKIAQKFYGSSSKAYRDAIVAANASLKGDANRIMAGVTYTIPAVDAQPSNPPAPAAPVPTQVVVSPKAPVKAPAGENWYTVKAGDNLWAIARDQCGDTAAIPALKELNKDSLKGGEGIRVGMKLKLPNKPVASIN